MVKFFLPRYTGPIGFAALLVALLLGSGCSLRNKKAETPPTARDLYTEGTKLVGKKKYEEARELFNKVKGMGTDPEVELLAQIAVADSYFEEREYVAARGLYEELYKLHAGGKVADYLLFRIAECSFWQIDTIDRDTTSAKEGLKALNRLILEYPESEYVAPARHRIKEITTFLAENEFFIGNFYLKKNALFAAINRFKKALTLYPGSGIEDKLIYHLYKTYKALHDEDHAQEYRALLEERYPHSEFIPLLAGPEPRSGAEGVSPTIGLAGSYQAEDRNSWARRLLFLGAEEPETAAARNLPPLSRDPEWLAERSWMGKIKPW